VKSRDGCRYVSERKGRDEEVQVSEEQGLVPVKAAKCSTATGSHL
jgi:hypothetical protein